MDHNLTEYLLEGETSVINKVAADFIKNTYPYIHLNKKLYDSVLEFVVKNLEKNKPTYAINKELMSIFYNGLILDEKNSDDGY